MPIHTEDLRRYLAESIGRPVFLRIHLNSSSMVTSRSIGGALSVGIHRMFLDADGATLAALARFVSVNDAPSRAAIRRFIAERSAANPAPPVARRSNRVKGTPVGKVYQLAERAGALNAKYFAGALKYVIEWAPQRPPARGYPRHITLGNWNPTLGLVRIHPMLDSVVVPPFFIDFVIYHELVHVALPSKVGCGGRMEHHPAEFYALEAKYERYEEGKRWERDNITPLVKHWCDGVRRGQAAELDGRRRMSTLNEALDRLFK